jgi:nucleoside-diphosphate-sugar epimerase
MCEGIGLRCLVRPNCPKEAIGELRSLAAATGARLEIVTGNLGSPDDVAKAMEEVQTVYHMAAEMRGMAANIFFNTVVASRNLLQAILRERPERVVLISTLNVYGLAEVTTETAVTEEALLEASPDRRDTYTHAKIRQEVLFRESLAQTGIGLTILRPGAIYGPGRLQIPSRLGLMFGKVLLKAGRSDALPVTYLENCADAVVFCGRSEAATGVFNVVDDDLPTGAQYLTLYRKARKEVRSIPVPYPVMSVLSRLNQVCHDLSPEQVPAALTPYKAASAWRGHRFSNEKLKALGWQQPVPTREAMLMTFAEQPDENLAA